MEYAHQPDGLKPTGQPVPRPRRKRWQVGLPSLLLVMAAIAVWMAFFINRGQNVRLESRIVALRAMVHELDIADQRKIAVVKLEEYWYDENRWDLYLPEGPYQLCVATRGIGNVGLASVVKSSPVEAGRHRLTLDQRRHNVLWRVTVTWDGAELLTVEEPKEWDPGSGSMNEAEYSTSQQLAPDKPVVLFRRRFMRRDAKGRTSSLGDEPAEGVLLWIERLNGSKAGKGMRTGDAG